MPCNCQNWDDESPCPTHELKVVRSPIVEHCCIVIHVYRRASNKKWFYTVARDAIQEFVSQDFETKKEATPI